MRKMKSLLLSLTIIVTLACAFSPTTAWASESGGPQGTTNSPPTPPPPPMIPWWLLTWLL